MIKRKKCTCVLCGETALKWKRYSGYNYYSCSECESIFIDPEIIEKIDNDGDFSLRKYDDDYWQMEAVSSKERSWGVALARMAEVIYYARTPVKAFLDIGGGPGYFLDAVAQYLPEHKEKFYSVEKYPPPVSENGKNSERGRTISSNYITTGYKDLPQKVQAGMCIEVVEHLTPQMFEGILKDIAMVSDEEAVYIFNTGMPQYVLNEDPDYMDPVRRGHIVSYSLKGVARLAESYGFTTIPIPGKTWAFVLEYHSKSLPDENITDRIWSALPENLDLLTSHHMGTVLKLLGLETARAYC